MSKSYKRGYRLCQFGCDIAAVVVAWRLTVWAGGAGPITSSLGLDWILLLWVAVAIWRNLYSAPIRTELWTAVKRAAETTLAVGLTSASLAMLSGLSDPASCRAFVVPFSSICFALLVWSRVVVHAMAGRVTRMLMPAGGVAVIGKPAAARTVASRIETLGAAVKGIIVPAEEGGRQETVIGTTHDLAAVINKEGLERLILVDAGLTDREVAWCLEVARRMGVQTSLAVCPPGPAAQVRLSMDDGLPLIDMEDVTLRAWQQFVKRLLDIVIAGASLALLAPLLVAIAVAIKLSSPGPVLYRAPRVGRGGRYFTFLKFRSMYTGARRGEVAAKNEKHGHIFKMVDDPRITRLGRILRRYSLDELPQLVNVLRGEMSIVGPRPLPAEDLGSDGMSQRYTVWSRQRSELRPGLTGLWQVRGRSSLSFDEMVCFDVEYVHKWSLGLDMSILLQTPWRVISGSGAH